MVKLYLLLGGNLGDKKQVFAEVAKRLTELLGEITALSSIYETEPWGFESEDIFWNQVLEFSTCLSAERGTLIDSATGSRYGAGAQGKSIYFTNY